MDLFAFCLLQEPFFYLLLTLVCAPEDWKALDRRVTHVSGGGDVGGHVWAVSAGRQVLDLVDGDDVALDCGVVMSLADARDVNLLNVLGIK